jgi:hypothetical protein
MKEKYKNSTDINQLTARILNESIALCPIDSRKELIRVNISINLRISL